MDFIRAAQRTYGEVLGITTVKAAEVSQAVDEERKAVHVELRDYIAKVAAWVEPEEEGSEQLAEALLAPLAAWESNKNSSSTGTSSATSSDPVAE